MAQLLYTWERYLTDLVTSQLSQVTPLSVGIVFLAGLLTSFSPCILSMLPITIGYLAGKSKDTQTPRQNLLRALSFILGLALTLTTLGLVAGWIGTVYGKLPLGGTFFVVMGLVAVYLGLVQLEVLQFRWPEIPGLADYEPPPNLRALFIGASFGLVASPCSSPVLVVLLGFVSTAQSPLLGAVLLFAYSLGHGLPLAVAAIFTHTIKGFLALRSWGAGLSQVSGVILLGAGVWMVLSNLNLA
ncbi:cytochrome c biogenesis CcdA family protein [Anthocerotibacter panamensis]|uniref:cytochrome c biogenesis CcdA family protein n=1 Tax=Anthocerotibacter panamensis TaxID=2857077 RepID=UPI001C404E4F|nr:cytochrome c biogenesis CcdA family protein [Anthocerotibacter panamensis]